MKVKKKSVYAVQWSLLKNIQFRLYINEKAKLCELPEKVKQREDV